MDRRSFFTSLTAVAAVPLVGCVGRDRPDPVTSDKPPPLVEFREFVVPDGIDPALPFVPLRRRR